MKILEKKKLKKNKNKEELEILKKEKEKWKEEKKNLLNDFNKFLLICNYKFMNTLRKTHSLQNS